MALLTLMLLKAQMPDLTARMFWALRSLRQTRMHVVGTANLPADGPVILVTNCRDAAECRNVVSATDRYVKVVAAKMTDAQFVRTAQRVHDGTVIALSAEAGVMLPVLQKQVAAAYIPVYYGHGPDAKTLRVAFGSPLPSGAKPDDVEAAFATAAALPDEEAAH
jgi:hypothetical protein